MPTALVLNCTLRRTPSRSQTQTLTDKAIARLEEEGVTVETIRVIDHDIEQGYWDEYDDWDSGERARRPDEWPWLLDRIRAADILVIATPLTLNMCSSVAHVILEKLNLLDEVDPETGQLPFYNKVACLVLSGIEDGAYHAAGTLLSNLTRLGFSVPPHAIAYWLGPAGTGPGYIEAHGDKHFHTNKLVRYMAKNVAHFAQMLADNPIPTNLVECVEAAAAESTDVFAIKVDVTVPGLRYRRYQQLGDVVLPDADATPEGLQPISAG
jgi:multimeric flavodoxin WrbA